MIRPIRILITRQTILTHQNQCAPPTHKAVSEPLKAHYPDFCVLPISRAVPASKTKFPQEACGLLPKETQNSGVSRSSRKSCIPVLLPGTPGGSISIAVAVVLGAAMGVYFVGTTWRNTPTTETTSRLDAPKASTQVSSPTLAFRLHRRLRSQLARRHPPLALRLLRLFRSQLTRRHQPLVLRLRRLLRSQLTPHHLTLVFRLRRRLRNRQTRPRHALRRLRGQAGARRPSAA